MNDLKYFTRVIREGWSSAQQEKQFCQTATAQSCAAQGGGGGEQRDEKQTKAVGTERKTRNDGEMERNKKK